MRKKGIAYTTLAVLLIAMVSFFVIWLVIDVMKSRAEEKTAEELCRLSIAAREHTKIQIAKGLIEKKMTPLLCPTAKSEDVGKDMTKEEVKEYIAKKIARCWYKYQEGNVKDVFEGSTFKDKCQICYPLNIKQWKNYNGPITNEELVVSMYNTIYKVREESDSCKMFGGKCMTEEECDEIIEENEYFKKDDDTECKKEEENKICCYSPYDCLNKGGVCSDEKPEETMYLEYDKWDCPSGKKCWIKEENYYTYLDYVQSYGGEGRLVILSEDIHRGKSYAISFGSPTEGKGIIFEGMKAGTIGGAGAAVVSIVLGATPAGWVAIGTYSLGYIFAGAAIGVGLGALDVEAHELVEKLFSERDINTIYLSTYNDAIKKCEVS